jgi:cyclopropane fatty-acyl-phospholipid synthase-like methyltransferase
LYLSRASVEAVGVDHSKLMIAQAAKRNRKAVNAGRLRLIEGTIEDVPAAMGPFHKVFSINVIQFVDRAAFVARAKGLLSAGGKFAATYQPRHAHATRADALKMAAELTELLNSQGFTDVRSEEIYLKPVPAVCVLGVRA